MVQSASASLGASSGPSLRAPGYLPLLSDLPIAWRVGGLAGIAVVALLAVGAAYVAIDQRIEAGLVRQGTYRALLGHQATLEHSALLMRRAEKDFLLRRDLKYATAQVKARETAAKAVVQASAMSEAAPIADKLARLRDGIDQLGRQFDDVVARAQALGLNESQGLQGTLRSAVQGAEKAVGAQAGRDDLLAKMLMMRRHEKDFIMRGDVKYVDDVRKRQGEFQALLAKGELAADQRATISADVEAYVRDFVRYAEASQQQDAAIRALSTAFSQIEPLFDQVEAFATERAAEVDRAIAAERARARITMLSAAGIVLVLAVVLGSLIARGVAAPLRSLAACMRRLADRDFAVAVLGTGYKDEIGQMARAVQVFKDNGIENERLQKETEEARLRQAAQEEEQRRLKEEAAKAETRREREAEEAKRRAADEQKATEERMKADAELRSARRI
jgi:methyl-accepting chemotaxis protein